MAAPADMQVTLTLVPVWNGWGRGTASGASVTRSRGSPPVADGKENWTRSRVQRVKVDIFMAHFAEACAYLKDRVMPPTEPERKHHEGQRRRC